MAEGDLPATFDTADDARRESGRGSPGAWRMVAVLLSLYILALVDRGAISLLVVPIQKQFGLTDMEMGVILGPAFAISYSIFGIPMGWASDRFPRRWIVFIAIFVWSLAAASSGLATSFGTLLLARVFVGVGEAALSPNAYSLIADAFPQRRLTFALSVYQMGSKLGAGVSFSAVALAAGIAAYFGTRSWPLVGHLEPWQLTLILTGAPGLLLAFLIFTFREPPRRDVAPGAPEVAGFSDYLRQNFAIIGLMMLGLMMISVAVLSLGAWAPTFIERQFGLKPQQYGPIISIIQLVGAGTLVFKGMFVDWLHSRGMTDAHLRFLSWLLAGAVPLTLIAFLSNSLMLFWICDGIIEIMAGQFITYIAATTQLIVPAQFRGRIMAVYQAGFTIVGMGAGPLIVAFLTQEVFADPHRIGQSLAIVASIGFLTSFLAIRAVLPNVRHALQTSKAACQ